MDLNTEGHGLLLTREEISVYLGTMKAIVKIIDDNKRISSTKLKFLLLAEIDSIKSKLSEN